MIFGKAELNKCREITWEKIGIFIAIKNGE